MATQLQLRRGTTAENDVFTGAVGELTMDTDTNGLRIHDGSTVGGVQVPTSGTADYVVEWQAPTDLNNYTWYRKYKSGWIEQGGSALGTGSRTVTFPIPMADTNYSVMAVANRSDAEAITSVSFTTKTTTSVNFAVSNINSSAYTWNSSNGIRWEVKGMAA